MTAQHEPYVSESLLITYEYPDKEVQVHDGPTFLAKYNFAVPFPECLIVLCTKHQQMVPVADNPNSLHDDAAKNPAKWCTGCQSDAPQVVLAPPPPPEPPAEPPVEPQVQDASCSAGAGTYVDTGVYMAPPTDAAMQEAATLLPESQPVAPSEPFPSDVAVPPEPVTPKAPKPVKPTALPPIDLIRSVLGHYRSAKATVEAITVQLEAAKAQAADCLTPLGAYAPSWQFEGLWYVVARGQTGKLTLRVGEKKPGRPANPVKEEGGT